MNKGYAVSKWVCRNCTKETGLDIRFIDIQNNGIPYCNDCEDEMELEEEHWIEEKWTDKQENIPGVGENEISSFDKLADHVGHEIECIGYGENEVLRVTFECLDCSTILLDIHKYAIAESPSKREFLEEMLEWLTNDGFIQDIHYDDQTIIDRVKEVIGS
jgi:hypothetical protein